MRLPPLPEGTAQWVVDVDDCYPIGVVRCSYQPGGWWKAWALDDDYEYLGSFLTAGAARRALYDRYYRMMLTARGSQ